MCMCCEIPIYVDKFIGGADIYKGLYYIFRIMLVMTFTQIVVCIVAISDEYSEDTLSDILFGMAVGTYAFTTLVIFIVHKKTTADLLLVAEYAVLLLPLPSLSLFGYTLLIDEEFFYINHVIQVIFSLLSLYFAIVVHSVYLQQTINEAEADKEVEETEVKH